MIQIYEPQEIKPLLLKLKSFKRWNANDGFVSFQFYLEDNESNTYSVRVTKRLIMKFFEDLLEDEPEGNL